MITLNSSAKPEKSLALLSDFENYIVKDPDLDCLSLSEIKTLMELCHFKLNSLKEEKTEFMLSTSLKLNSPVYNATIGLFNQRRSKIMKSYMIIESRLRQEKEKFNRLENDRKEKEDHFMFFFLKNAACILDTETFTTIVEETEKKYAFPESLKERI